MSYDRSEASDATPVNALHSGASPLPDPTGRNQYRVLTGERYLVHADSPDAAIKKLHACYNAGTCPDHETTDCWCIEEEESDTIVLDQPTDTAQILEALNADSMISLLPIYVRERLTQIIEGATREQ